MNILITGGASGIGRAITENIARKASHKVYITYAKSIAAAKELEQTYSSVTAIQCDFMDSSSVNNFVSQLSALNVDVLINNAITGLVEKHFHKIESHEFLDSFKNNIVPTIQITQECIKIFRKKKLGRIVTVLSSYMLNRPPTGMSAYVAEKAYLHSLCKSWASENANFNIISNCVAPSITKTQLTQNIDERILEQMVMAHPLKRLLTVEEIADAVFYLTEASPHINGICLPINAGADIA